MNGSENGSKTKRNSSFRFWLSWLAVPVVFWGLVFVLSPHYSHRSDPKIKTVIIQIAKFKNALEIFNVDNGHYPPGTNGLNDLVVKPSDATTNWHPYLDKILLDPWGQPYHYECPGEHNANSYDLSSAGFDGKFGTEDDIGNWSQR